MRRPPLARGPKINHRFVIPKSFSLNPLKPLLSKESWKPYVLDISIRNKTRKKRARPDDVPKASWDLKQLLWDSSYTYYIKFDFIQVNNPFFLSFRVVEDVVHGVCRQSRIQQLWLHRITSHTILLKRVYVALTHQNRFLSLRNPLMIQYY